MTRNLIIYILMVFPVLAASCAKTEVENAYTKQDGYIESLVSSMAPEGSDATVEYFDGTVRVTVRHGEGEALESGGAVTFFYAGHVINSASLGASNLFVTNNKDIAASANWEVSDSSIFAASTVKPSKDALVKGLKKGLARVRKGDECYIMFNGKYGFGKHTTGKVPAYSALAYHLWITDVAN